MPTVLVVEDEALIRMSACMQIEDLGFSTVEAKNAEKAIEAMQGRFDIRLIFTDVDMPGDIDGLKLAHFANGRWPGIKILVTSGKIAIRQSELPQGAEFLAKPYSEADVGAVIARLLADVELPPERALTA